MKLFDKGQAVCVSQEYIASVAEAQRKIIHIITLLSFSIVSGQSQCPFSMRQIEYFVPALTAMYQLFGTEYLNEQEFNDCLEALDIIKQNLDITVPHWGPGYCSEQSDDSARVLGLF